MNRVAWVLVLLCFGISAFAQTPVEMATLPMLTYTESFDDITNWTDGFTSGIGAEHFGAVAAQGSGTIPDATHTTHSTLAFANSGSGGVRQDAANGHIKLLATGPTDNTNAAAIDFFMDFTSVNAGTLSFHWEEVNNGQSTSNRKGSLRVYGSVDGATFTELPGAEVLDITNYTPSSGDVVNVAMPSSFSGSASAQLRFYYYNGTGGTSGSRPYIALDDITVTASGSPCATPFAQPTALTLTALSDTTVQGNFAPSVPATDEYLVMATASSALSALPVDSVLYQEGDILGNAVVAYRGPANNFIAGNFAASTTYHFFVFSVNLYCSGALKYNTLNPLTGNATTLQGSGCMAPVSQPSNLQFSSVNHLSISGSFDAAADASDYLVVRSTNNSLSAIPVDDTIYQPGSSLGGGTVVSWSGNAAFTAIGLTPATTYYFFVFGANHSNCSNGPVYNTTPLTATQATNAMPTCVAPSGSAKDIILKSSEGHIAGFFTPYDMATEGYLVVMSTNTTLNAMPVDGSVYNTGDQLGGGSIVSNGANYSFTAPDLTDSATYYFFVFSYNANCIGGPAYRTTDFLTGSFIANWLPPAGYYFGNLHAHSSYSDGNKDDQALTPADDYDFAKNSMCMDFLGISEHNHFSFNNNPGMLLPRYADGLNEAATFTAANPSFLALYGMEWGVISNGGHVLVYGASQLWGWEQINGSPNYDVFVPKYDYLSNNGLFQKINDYQAIGSLAHPATSDYGNLLSISYDQRADSAISAVAVESGPAFSTETSYDDPASSMSYISYFHRMLAKGYHVAPAIDHDNHNLTFGRTAETRTAVISPSLDKNDFLAAVKDMHCYATQDCDTRVVFDIYGQNMGSIMKHDYAPAIHISVFNPTSAAQDTPIVKIMYGIAGNNVLYTQLVADTGFTMDYTDHALLHNNEAYYFADVTVAGKRTITAPIWYSRTDAAPSAIYEVARKDYQSLFSIVTNPVKDEVVLQASEYYSKSVQYTVRSANGAALKSGVIGNVTSNSKYSISVADLPQGFYIIQLEGKDIRQAIKFIK